MREGAAMRPRGCGDYRRVVCGFFGATCAARLFLSALDHIIVFVGDAESSRAFAHGRGVPGGPCAGLVARPREARALADRDVGRYRGRPRSNDDRFGRELASAATAGWRCG